MVRLNRWWVRSLLAMLLAWVGVLVAVVVWAGCGYPWVLKQGEVPQQCDLPSERVMLVPFGAWYTAEQHIASSVPVIQLREPHPGEYELLYWGNPVRPRYAYRALSIMSGNSVLLRPDGTVEPLRNLPVPTPKRQDGRLPLQPVQKLGKLRSAPGGYCAVRVEVLAADSGAVLCWKEYLLRCPEQN